MNHIMCSSKILTDLCFTKQKIKTKYGFVYKTKCLQCFSSKNVLIKHKKNGLSLNGKQSVKL